MTTLLKRRIQVANFKRSEFYKELCVNDSCFMLVGYGSYVKSLCYNSIDSDIRRFFHVSLTQSAITGSMFSLGFAIGCLLFGAISDKYGRKNVILMGLIGLAIISFLLGLVNSLSWLVVLRGLQGIAAATFSPVALAYVVESFPVEKKVTTIGFVSTGFLVAGIVGQVMSTVISQYFGWHMVFFLLSSVYMVTALWIYYSLPRGESSQSYTDILGPVKQMGKVFTQKT